MNSPPSTTPALLSPRGFLFASKRLSVTLLVHVSYFFPSAKQKLLDERHWLIHEAYMVNPNFKPPADYKSNASKLTRKIYIPYKEYTHVIHFVNCEATDSLNQTASTPFSASFHSLVSFLFCLISMKITTVC